MTQVEAMRATARRVLAPVLVAAAAWTALPATATVAVAQDGPIVSRMTAKCIDIPGGNTANGTRVVLWDCHGGPNQRFTRTASGELRSMGKCLDALGGRGANGDAIALWDCTGGANQKWTLQSNGQYRGINSRCIDVSGGNQSNGAQMVLWDCHGAANQLWQHAGGTVASAPAPAGGRVEQCFGAVGNMCEGAKPVPNLPVDFAPVTRNADGTYTAYVSVGSIFHDNCCVAKPDGQHCKGFNAAQEGPGWGDDRPCVKEWRKAFYNSRDKRMWRATFGPYASASRGDDLTPTGARAGMLFNLWGQQAGHYSGRESNSTRRLGAPSGTALDATDAAFCASGRFREIRRPGWGVSDYGICA